jgi:hypothetical protein
MNKMLNSPGCGQRTFQLLLDVLCYSDSVSLYRGATFFLGMSMWGKFNVEKIQKNNNGIVLKSFLKVMTHQNELVAHEILFILNRLVLKHSMNINFEWEMIIEILIKMEEMNPMVEEKDTRVMEEMLMKIVEIFKSGKYCGDEEEFFKLMKLYKHLLTEKTNIYLIEIYSKEIHPSLNNWRMKLKEFIRLFYLNESRALVKLNLLENLKIYFWKFKNIYADEILEEILPIFEYSKDSTNQISLLFLIEILNHNSSLKKFNQFIYLLDKFIQQENDSSLQLEATIGLIHIFKTKFISLPCSESNIIFTTLIKRIQHKNEQIRETILSYLLSLKSDKYYKLQCDGIVSPYLRCHSKDLLRTISWVLPVSLLFDSLIEQLKVENSYSVSETPRDTLDFESYSHWNERYVY